jgi:hypothetical protein
VLPLDPTVAVRRRSVIGRMTDEPPVSSPTLGGLDGLGGRGGLGGLEFACYTPGSTTWTERSSASTAPERARDGVSRAGTKA